MASCIGIVVSLLFAGRVFAVVVFPPEPHSVTGALALEAGALEAGALETGGLVLLGIPLAQLPSPTSGPALLDHRLLIDSRSPSLVCSSPRAVGSWASTC